LRLCPHSISPFLWLIKKTLNIKQIIEDAVTSNYKSST